MAYRISRNVEASIIDKITENLELDGWKDIRVIKAFLEAYEGKLPCIVINVLDRTPLQLLEIGNKKYIKFFTLEVRVFAKSDGQRLDLSDWLFELFEDDFSYFEYNITDGVITEKRENGKINVVKCLNNRKELTNTEGLALEDRYRHLLIFQIKVSEKC